MKRKAETLLAAKIIGVFRRVGAECLRLHSGGAKVKRGFMKFNEKGCADWLVLFPSAPRFVEIKLPGETPRLEQIKWRTKVERLGFIVDTVTSVEEAFAVAKEALERRSA